MLKNSKNLLPCPFCGGDPFIHEDDEGIPAWVACSVCGATGPDKDSVLDIMLDIIEGWNKRARVPVIEESKSEDSAKGKKKKHYRVLSLQNPYGNYMQYYVQKKFLFFWLDLGNSSDDYGGTFYFKTKEAAYDFIDGGCKDPFRSIIKVVDYVER